MADLLAGRDSQCDVSVIFTFGRNFNGYRRLGSNGLKTGASLSDFVAQCVDTHTQSELIYRCVGIILESIASSGGESDRGKNRNQEHDSVPVEQE